MVTEGYLTQTLRLEGARGFRAAPPVRERGQEAAPTRAPIAGAGQGRSRNVPALMRPTRVLAALLSLSLLGLALPGTRFRLRFPFPLGFALGFASQRIHVRVLGHTPA